MSEPTSEELLAWVERIASYMNEQDGVPLVAGRVLGWLMICDPPEQTAGQIASAIDASRASLTTSLRQLRSIGLIRKTTRPGDPSAYYGMADDAWFAVVRKQVASLSELGRIARDGMDLVGAGSERSARARNAYDVSVWMTGVFERALETDEERAREAGDGSARERNGGDR